MFTGDFRRTIPSSDLRLAAQAQEAVSRAPHNVMLQRKHCSSVLGIARFGHASSYESDKFIMSTLGGGCCPEFPRRLKAAVPFRRFLWNTRQCGRQDRQGTPMKRRVRPPYG